MPRDSDSMLGISQVVARLQALFSHQLRRPLEALFSALGIHSAPLSAPILGRSADDIPVILVVRRGWGERGCWPELAIRTGCKMSASGSWIGQPPANCSRGSKKSSSRAVRSSQRRRLLLPCSLGQTPASCHRRLPRSRSPFRRRPLRPPPRSGSAASCGSGTRAWSSDSSTSRLACPANGARLQGIASHAEARTEPHPLSEGRLLPRRPAPSPGLSWPGRDGILVGAAHSSKSRAMARRPAFVLLGAVAGGADY